MTSRGAPRAEGGFTLLEILVALTVLGLLIIGLTQGVHAGLAMWQAQSRRVGETAELDAAARALRGLLSGMPTPPPGAAATNGGNVQGRANSLVFVADLPTGLGTVRRVDIDLELHGRRLVLSWTPHGGGIPIGAPPKPVETELIAGVERLDLAYWGAPAPDQPAGWQTSWDGPQLPELIRLRLGFTRGDRRHWPDLIVAPEEY